MWQRCVLFFGLALSSILLSGSQMFYIENKAFLSVSTIVTNCHSSSEYQKTNQKDAIEYFPWNDGLDYSQICMNITKILKSNQGPAIIHYGSAGGLAHKFQTLLFDITLALLLKRKLYRYHYYWIDI